MFPCADSTMLGTFVKDTGFWTSWSFGKDKPKDESSYKELSII